MYTDTSPPKILSRYKCRSPPKDPRSPQKSHKSAQTRPRSPPKSSKSPQKSPKSPQQGLEFPPKYPRSPYNRPSDFRNRHLNHHKNAQNLQQ